MLRAVQNNPYRILGVYSNSPKKDMLSNLGKLKAFLKVGKSMSFPLDLPSYLPEITRTEQCVEIAQSAIELPMDQIKHSMFWFMKLTPLDEVAFKNLFNGNIAQAKDIWSKKDGVSSQINLMVCGMLEGVYSAVVVNADKLFQQFGDEYCKIVNETVKLSSFELTQIFIDTLKSDGEFEMANIANIPGTSDTWQKIAKSGLVAPLIGMITTAIADAKSAKGPQANYNAGVKLMNSTKKPLLQLKSLLGISDMQYQMTADKLAQAILQCGINYFNDSEDDDTPQKAMTLQGYALSIAVGQIVKDRCKENVNVLNNIGPEYRIQKEMRSIGERLERFKAKPSNEFRPIHTSLFGNYHTISEIGSFVDGCKVDLSSIAQKLGRTDSLYLKISSAVASAAINALVEKINAAQKIATISSDLSSLRSDASLASAVMSKLSSFDMTTECRNYFNKNNTALQNINSQLSYRSHPTTYSSSNTSSSSSSDGCYIATMVYGDYDHPQVMVLRDFRDSYLKERNWGKRFIKFYYKHSPNWVEKLKNHKLVNRTIKAILDIFVSLWKKKYSYE